MEILLFYHERTMIRSIAEWQSSQRWLVTKSNNGRLRHWLDFENK